MTQDEGRQERCQIIKINIKLNNVMLIIKNHGFKCTMFLLLV